MGIFGRRLRPAAIGGGPGSFIGVMHRTAARLDDRTAISTDGGRLGVPDRGSPALGAAVVPFDPAGRRGAGGTFETGEGGTT